MIDKLKQIERKLLPDLLKKSGEWNSLMIDYHAPIVERLWTQIGNYRVSLHFIHPCDTKDALYHPHPWPSAMHVLHGKYEMGLGIKYLPGFIELSDFRHDGSLGETIKYVGQDLENCEIFTREISKIEMNGENYYEMIDPKGWHYVRPIGGPCASVMLMGKPWDKNQFEGESEKPEGLKPLDGYRKMIILEWFQNFFSVKTQITAIEENKEMKRSDWVKFNENAIIGSDKKKYEKFFGKLGFVIGVEKNVADVRFGNERVRVGINILMLLDELDRQIPKKEEAKKIDDMDPSNWPDDDF